MERKWVLKLLEEESEEKAVVERSSRARMEFSFERGGRE